MNDILKILIIFAIAGIVTDSFCNKMVCIEPFPASFISIHNLKIYTMNNLKDIPNYEGLYAATKDGKIFSYPKPCSSKKGIFLKQYISIIRHNRTKPYKLFTVGLSKNKKRKTYSVHRLIAFTYIPNPENKPDINHIDGNPLNNNVENLEWCTKKENMKHAINTGLLDFYTEKQIRIRIENGQKTIERNRLKRQKNEIQTKKIRK